jgi:putative hemolysin
MQLVEALAPPREISSSQFIVQIASSGAQVEAAQRLRYKVFAEELGADISRHDGRDVDAFDSVCEHLIVTDQLRDKVVGTYRILPPWGAHKIKRRYSETEFRIDSLRPIAHQLFEVGRACIHPAYRCGTNGTVLARLWSGLGAYVRDNQVKYLGGCASVPLERGALNLGSLRAELMAKHLAPYEYRVDPIRGLPNMGDPEGATPAIPPLLKGYLRLGAWVCGEAAWDPDFDTADFFVLLPVERIAARYARHFLGTETAQ